MMRLRRRLLAERLRLRLADDGAPVGHGQRHEGQHVPALHDLGGLVAGVAEAARGLAGGDEGGEAAGVVALFKGGEGRAGFRAGDDDAVLVHDLHVAGLAELDGPDEAADARIGNVHLHHQIAGGGIQRMEEHDHRVPAEGVRGEAGNVGVRHREGHIRREGDGGSRGNGAVEEVPGDGAGGIQEVGAADGQGKAGETAGEVGDGPAGDFVRPAALERIDGGIQLRVRPAEGLVEVAGHEARGGEAVFQHGLGGFLHGAGRQEAEDADAQDEADAEQQVNLLPE